MWLDILRELKKELTPLVDEVIIGGYRVETIRPKVDGKGLIFLIRDNERKENNGLIEEDYINIYLDAWTRCDSVNIEEGYTAIYSIEEIVDNCLETFKNKDYIGDIRLLDLNVTEKIGDLDSLRPNIGVRYLISFTVVKEMNAHE